jgi:hypothetical protein
MTIMARLSGPPVSMFSRNCFRSDCLALAKSTKLGNKDFPPFRFDFRRYSPTGAISQLSPGARLDLVVQRLSQKLDCEALEVLGIPSPDLNCYLC